MKQEDGDGLDLPGRGAQRYGSFEEERRFHYNWGPSEQAFLPQTFNEDRGAFMMQPIGVPLVQPSVQYCSLREVIDSGFPNVDKAIRISSDPTLLTELRMCSMSSQVLTIFRDAILSLAETNRKLQERLSQIPSPSSQQFAYPGENAMNMDISNRIPQPEPQIYMNPTFQSASSDFQQVVNMQYNPPAIGYEPRPEALLIPHQSMWGAAQSQDFCLPSPPNRLVDTSAPNSNISNFSNLSSSSSSSNANMPRDETKRMKKKKGEREAPRNASDSSSSSTRASDSDTLRVNKFWSKEEHKLFLEGIKKYHEPNIHGSTVSEEERRVGLGQGIAELIAEHVKTRSVAQVRSHAQKYFIKQWKHKQEDGEINIEKKEQGEGQEHTPVGTDGGQEGERRRKKKEKSPSSLQ